MQLGRRVRPMIVLEGAPRLATGPLPGGGG
jgi:hypothetical protein